MPVSFLKTEKFSLPAGNYRIKKTFFKYLAAMPFYTAKAYVHHLRVAKRWSAFHSPYLFKLFQYCCDEQNNFPGFDKIESWRKELKSDWHKITRHDFGAGATRPNQIQTVADVAKRSLSLPFQCRFIARLFHAANIHSALEFGTCLGISAAYMHAGNNQAKIVSVEGDAAVARVALTSFEKLSISNVQLVIATFDSFLANIQADQAKFDFIFLDGNHRSVPLLAYYDQLKDRVHENSIIMVDDIHWSADMQSGWDKLILKQEVTQSVDCFHFGLLFFKKDFLAKENHVIRLPWNSIMG